MALTRGVIVIPTYNEKDNIAPLIDAVWKQLPGVDVLIVDDNSPDGTGILADDLSSRFPGRIVISGC